jgi:hypothetical protein
MHLLVKWYLRNWHGHQGCAVMKILKVTSIFTNKLLLLQERFKIVEKDGLMITSFAVS